MKNVIYLILLMFIGCKTDKPNIPVKENPQPIVKMEQVIDYDTTRWTEITEVDLGVSIDIKYATEDNFTAKQIYDCGRCFLKPEMAEKVKNIARKLNEENLGLRIYDCYRPRPFQQRLWDAKPDARYVTPPKRGSYHSRGLAIDLTIVDEDGKILDMGTPYDSFSKLSHTDHDNLPKAVLNNRKMLKNLMLEQGLKGIRTEWWHFSLYKKASLEDWVWSCKN